MLVGSILTRRRTVTSILEVTGLSSERNLKSEISVSKLTAKLLNQDINCVTSKSNFVNLRVEAKIAYL